VGEETAAVGSEQLALLRSTVRSSTTRPPPPVAAELPVARVAVDVQLAHLDRAFDYLVPETLSLGAVPGARVKVRFAGRDVAGFVLERSEGSEHLGRLAMLRRVVSPEPVLSPEIAALARAVADRYAGTLADVLRLAVPPRHARVEGQVPKAAPEPGSPAGDGDGGAWAAYGSGPELLAAIARGGAPHAVWSALPGPHPRTGAWPRWPVDLAAVVQACATSDRGALVVVPDRRDVDLVADAVDEVLGAPVALRLTADLGPAERYRRWLAVRRGTARIVVGTRAAAFAPVRDLGLVVVWDDGDDLHKEPRAPYPHTRDVLLLRAHLEGAAALVGGFAVTAEAAELVKQGWAHAVGASRATVRRLAPLVQAPTADHDDSDPAWRGRVPTGALEVVRKGLESGPVLVQVPRGGYVPALACARCRAPARCALCPGPLALGGADRLPQCRWCGRAAPAWECGTCRSTALRAPVVGASRTAEELGRAFPVTPVIRSGADHVVARVVDRPSLVISTTGAEPVADGGYAAALLLDGWLLLDRADLRAGEEAFRRWMVAASLVRPAASGGRVVVLAPARSRAVQAMVRWDPFGHAERELDDRAAAGLPPAIRLAAIEGEPDAVADLIAAATTLPSSADVLGPVTLADGTTRALVRAPHADAAALAAALRAAQAVRSARKAVGSVKVELDPLQLA
jgi:primosomal protein N' (replication factor Y)